MKYLIKYNESIKHLLKPKSEEDIKKTVQNLSPQEKLEYGYNYDMIYLFKQGLDEGGNPFYQFNDYIKDSIINNKTEFFKILFDKYKDKYHFYDSLIHACSMGNLEIIKILLDNGKRGNKQYHPIISASRNGYLNVVKLLLNYKEIDPSVLTNKSIKDAYTNGYVDVVKLLLNDNRVKSKLTKKLIDRFENFINNTNESIKHLLKPKSEEDIKKNSSKFITTRKIISCL